MEHATQEEKNAMSDEEYEQYREDLRAEIFWQIINLRHELTSITAELASCRAEAETDDELTEEDRQAALEHLAALAGQAGCGRDELDAIEKEMVDA